MVAADVRGDKILPIVRSGRSDKACRRSRCLMPTSRPSSLSFTIRRHRRTTQLAVGAAVDVADLLSGDVTAGKRSSMARAPDVTRRAATLQASRLDSRDSRCFNACSTPLQEAEATHRRGVPLCA